MVNHMDRQQKITPTTPRAKTVYFIWSILPRLVLLAMMVTIVVLFMTISKKKDSIAADKAAAVSKERPPVNSVIYPLELSAIRDRINLPGTIEPWTSLELLARIDGFITEVLVEEGDEVEKGQVLALIDEDDYKIALQRATAAYTLAKANYERDKKVYDKGVIPEAQLDTTKTAMLTAKADLDDAKLRLSRCTIKAPINGIIRRLDAEEGLLLAVGDPVAQILKIDKVKAIVGIPESDVSAVRDLEEIDVTIQALDNRVITAKKHFLSPSPETTARLYTMELEVDNGSRDILPGMFIRADIVKKKVTDTITIPFYSVITRNDEQFVFVEKDGVAHKRDITLGIMENWMVQITSGLTAGERLVIEGHRDIEDGQQINVVKVISNPNEYTL
jgi:membrane fusion protein, multidrug efflux system